MAVNRRVMRTVQWGGKSYALVLVDGKIHTVPLGGPEPKTVTASTALDTTAAKARTVAQVKDMNDNVNGEVNGGGS